jgi:alkaline phosphatase D
VPSPAYADRRSGEARGSRRESRPDGSAGSDRRGDLRKVSAGSGVARDRRSAGSGGAQTIAFGYIKPDVQANKAASVFVAASGKKDALASFFTRFLLNCDQWDGYNSERKALMAHLKTNNIGNVVALTGDIHSLLCRHRER